MSPLVFNLYLDGATKELITGEDVRMIENERDWKRMEEIAPCILYTENLISCD